MPGPHEAAMLADTSAALLLAAAAARGAVAIAKIFYGKLYSLITAISFKI